ncbi:tumor necrosis factor receptor superfamily member 13B isoform X1 [Phyllopteryx taeniolatus]|uniref:tumor necrosis factor receptor superfamily member 13B isoform X1 n=1 Tax=Phyllopteryx taeniolatus TaxID=161469 RepID=UPI002AD2E075|nr:tumor necrosis factor receptor superfamily member 13B isoform X1 [Phyllopteryx taeniolatus]XP_061612395.1 tumor necrosis factor receptor superfamily member 13B isoform X1 [Phyllopteryx taeniolatus]
MGANCPAGQHWDSLIKKCMQCKLTCRQPLIISKCTKYCVLADCKTLPGHYYDALLRECVRCADVCGRHPAECTQHCSTPVTSKKLLVKVTSVHTALVDSTVLLYVLLALCIGLLLSSLSLALVVFLRRRSGAETNPNQMVVEQRQGDCHRGGQPGPSSADFMLHASRATEPSDESSPTETCVCVHCYPDLATMGGNNEGPSRAPMNYDHKAVLHHARMRNQSLLVDPDVSHLQTGGA